jgi:hypothetical protein
MRLIATTFLSLTLLLSTTGLSVVKHYCGEDLAHTRVVTTHNPGHNCQAEQQPSCAHCEEQKQSSHPCEQGASSEQQAHDCCDNEIETLKVEDPFLAVSQTFPVNLEALFLALKPYCPSFQDTDFTSSSDNYQNPPSHALPPATRGLRVFVQSFQL